jgi:glucuronoarabinoxylan endo-1,4-beta-xylanase
LSYSLLKSSDVSLKVFDVTGREVATLVDAARVAGEHVMSWDASALASGVYFAVLRAGGNATVRKMVLMK